jgi:hypothetical protein
MKILIPSLLLALAIATANAQTAPGPVPLKDQSSIEDFSASAGTVIQRELTRLGDVAGLQVDLVKASDLINKASFYGVRLSRNAPTGALREENTAFVDAEEIDRLTKAIDLIKTSAFTTAPDNFTDLAYRTRGGFAIGALYANRKWSAFLRLDRYEPKTAVYLDESQLDTLRAYLVKAKESIR